MLYQLSYASTLKPSKNTTRAIKVQGGRGVETSGVPDLTQSQYFYRDLPTFYTLQLAPTWLDAPAYWADSGAVNVESGISTPCLTEVRCTT
jgi:hypothetical protein